jgi:hypothetical protein
LELLASCSGLPDGSRNEVHFAGSSDNMRRSGYSARHRGVPIE